jgi:hypothetical protein
MLKFIMNLFLFLLANINTWWLSKGKAVPVQAWTGPEGSRRLSPIFQDNRQMKVASSRHRPPLSAGNIPGTHLCWRLSRPQSHSAAGRIMSMKNSNDAIRNRTRDLPVSNTLPQPAAPSRDPVFWGKVSKSHWRGPKILQNTGAITMCKNCRNHAEKLGVSATSLVPGGGGAWDLCII